jgi:hypothetical protein
LLAVAVVVLGVAVAVAGNGRIGRRRIVELD